MPLGGKVSETLQTKTTKRRVALLVFIHSPAGAHRLRMNNRERKKILLLQGEEGIKFRIFTSNIT